MIVNCLYAPKPVNAYLNYNLYAVIVCILQNLVSHGAFKLVTQSKLGLLGGFTEFKVVQHFANLLRPVLDRVDFWVGGWKRMRLVT